MRRSLFFKKVAGLRPSTLSKKRLRRICFPVNFAKLFRTPFLQIQTYEGMKYCQFTEAVARSCSLK